MSIIWKMALSESFHNITANYRFHFSVKGGLLPRLAYLTLYYFIFIFFRRGDRYLRCLNWLKSLGFSDKEVEVETSDNVRLRLDLHTAFDPLFSILHDKDYERIEDFRPLPGQVIFDAGANVGIFTTYAAKKVGESGKIVAIEPHPDNFSLLSSNVERNGFRNVQLVKAAADERKATAELFVHERCINHSLRHKTGKSMLVEVRALDELVREFGVKRLDLIKIDTEGNVFGILRGAQESLRQFRPRIVFESDSKEESQGLMPFLEELGYDFREIRCFTYAWPRSEE